MSLWLILIILAIVILFRPHVVIHHLKISCHIDPLLRWNTNYDE